MAKTPKVKTLNSTKRKKTKPRRSKPALTTTTECECCAACSGIPTGHIGIPWRDAAGTWQCLSYDASARIDKRVAVDENGPYLANP